MSRPDINTKQHKMMWFFPYRGPPVGHRNRRFRALKTGGFRANWLREIPPSAKAGHEGLYPGIELVFHAPRRRFSLSRGWKPAP